MESGFFISMAEVQGVRAALGLIAAQAIAKLGIPPIPIPHPSQHFPAWKDYCDVLEEHARVEGKAADYSDAVPVGLGVADRDAVDPCTREPGLPVNQRDHPRCLRGFIRVLCATRAGRNRSPVDQ